MRRDFRDIYKRRRNIFLKAKHSVKAVVCHITYIIKLLFTILTYRVISAAFKYKGEVGHSKVLLGVL